MGLTDGAVRQGGGRADTPGETPPLFRNGALIAGRLAAELTRGVNPLPKSCLGSLSLNPLKWNQSRLVELYAFDLIYDAHRLP